jgi:ABC-type transport system involved in multi-copper enzyme maturation permease subunit
MLLFVQNMRGWLARHLPWSNSRQAWQERGAGLLLMLSALALWRWAGQLPVASQIGLWCLLALVAACLYRRSWVRLFGPVLLFEMVRTGRRRRIFLVRAAYAFILLGILFVVYWSWFLDRQLTLWELMGGASLRAQDLAQFASSFFYVFMAVQFLTVVWLTPAYTAGAIAVEKERQTLDALLATDLRNREIVLSTYLSRLANLILLILAGLPILAILQLMGGVDPNLVLAGFVAVGLTAISLAALGTVNSLYARKPRDAVTRTYLMFAAYVILSGLSWLLLLPQLNLATFPSTDNWTSPIELQDAVEWASIGNLPALIGQLIVAINSGKRLDLLVPSMLEKYAWFHGLVTIGCGVLTVARFRAKVLEPRETMPKGTRRKRRRLGFWRLWTGRPPVTRRAILWKEVFVDVKGRRRLFGWLASGVLFAVALLPAVHLVHFFGRYWPQGAQDSLTIMLSYWVRGASAFLGTAMLLGVAVRAAGCVSGERDRQTLDGLLATPLDNRTILWEKWLGCIFSQRWSAAALLLIWIIGYVTGSLHPLGAVCFAIAWLGYAGFVAGLGLWFSVANRSTLRSVFGTLCAMILMQLLLLLIAFDIPEMWLPGWLGNKWGLHWLLEQWGFLLLPPATLGFLAFSPVDFQNWLTGNLEMGYAPLLLGIEFLLWWLAAAGLVKLANIRFRVVTGRTSGLPNPPCSLPVESRSHAGERGSISAPSASGANATGLAGACTLPSSNNEKEGPSAYEEITGPTHSWRLTAWFLFFLPLIIGLGWYGYSHFAAERSLEQAIADADRLDPGWRLLELEAKRTIVPYEENSTYVIREVRTRLPGDWEVGRLYDQFQVQGLDPEKQLKDRQVQVLTELLEKAEPVLILARRLVDMPRGRAPITWSPDGLWMMLVDTQNSRSSANLLMYDTLLRTQEHDVDGALDSCRGIINAGRSIGDEPSLVSVLVRIAIRGVAINSLERAIAQGEPGDEAMRKLQSLLEDEEKAPLLVIGFRGERASFDRLMERLQSGEMSTKVLRGLWGGGSQEAILISGPLKGQRASMLEIMTESVEAAKLPIERQEAEFKRIDASISSKPLITRMVLPAVGRVEQSYWGSQARLRAAIVALAIERYRRQHGRWPDSLAELVPDKLAAIPADPYDGQPLRYRRNSDGVIIYSVGPDKVDDGGKLDRNKPGSTGRDIGIQLWDPAKRRQPPPTPKTPGQEESPEEDDK